MSMGAVMTFGSLEPKERMDILIVEDDEDLRGALRDILSSEGYEVATAANGERALELLRSSAHSPRLILLDLMMPDMDGWEFLTRIDSDSRLHRIPVALMSAHASVSRAFTKHRREGGPVRLLFPKPLNLLRLLATAQAFCSKGPIAGEELWASTEAPTARFAPLPDVLS
jgi:CheY-like chemotaxis protein